MATTVTCDICECEIKERKICVNVFNGEHLHSGSTITKTIDCCSRCASQIPGLVAEVEWSTLKMDYRDRSKG